MTIADPDAARVHRYWFGDGTGDDQKERSTLWFNGGPTVDQHISSEFGELITAGAEGRLAHWCQDPQGTVTLIVVLDQFPLNAFRKTAQAFAYEQQAIDVCLQGLSRGDDRKLSQPERLFFYLPLSHSENLQHQDQVVTLFEQLVADADDGAREFAEYSLKSAVEHREQIREFGRYPYRNEVLGRASTDKELEWLAGNPSRYGQ